jgi:hypothetical protein
MRLRFFFDAGSGVCLWAQDDAAKQRFGYAVELDDLDLPHDLRADLVQLIADYDATIDWNNPGAAPDIDTGPISFGYEPDAPFRGRVEPLLPRLRAALGPEFAVESDYEG